MASTLFRSLTQRPGSRKPVVPAKLPPLVGKILNKVEKPVVKVTPTIPAATRASTIKIPTPPALKTMTGTIPKVAQDAIARAVKPKPEQPTSSAPATLFHRAIERVAATPRMPNRGAAVTLHGKAIVMPDGSVGGSPVTPQPLQRSLSSIFNQITLGGGTPQVRATQIGALTRESYLDRVRNRPVQASIGRIVRRGLVQRPGSAVVMKSFPSTMGALDKAQIHRRKPGTPTGIVGDRAVQTPTAHVGVIYAKTVAPAVTNDRYLTEKIGGTYTARAPIAGAASAPAAPNMSVAESIGKAYAWAPPDTTSTTPAGAAVAVQSSGERWGLLLAVGVVAFLLIRR